MFHLELITDAQAEAINGGLFDDRTTIIMNSFEFTSARGILKQDATTTNVAALFASSSSTQGQIGSVVVVV